MSLLEVIIASTMLTMLLGTVSLVLRTGRLAWEAHESDFTRIEAAQATMRHMVRAVRQARRVVSASPAGDTSGFLSLEMADGQILAWEHDEATNTVLHGVNAADSLLADRISGLEILSFEADGVTPAATAATTQSLEIRVTVTLERETGAQRTVSSWAWVRAW